ncbi:glycosyltransferase [Mangrovimonas sp. YM274]|uniref:glycosyltransferase family 2 protein n=1 Tax=Mangrovimonas sp. YM274 TaxID=3070660 RepID=UPI0027DE78EF|nr:glycosyltransferase [Mangrovimonas sp. YM274]WMI69849.1 glycosyltransferase [Mangrovimonas sp. YM274]
MKEHLNTQPLISVVMATYNGEKFIAEAIQSILDQTYKNFEFLIVDDGSTDRTQEIIRGFRDHRIRYIKKEANTGIADSLNKGIAQAQGTYIARMDDDDVSFPHRLERQLEVFANDNQIIFCGTSVEDINGKTLGTPSQHEDISLKLVFSNPIFHPTVMIPREILLLERYNPNAVPSEDYDLWSRLIFKGKFHQLEEALLYCRIHQTSVTANRRKEQLVRNIPIAQYIHKKLGILTHPEQDDLLRAFTEHDYTINGIELRSLVSWFEKLKKGNADKRIFDKEKFDSLSQRQLEGFLISYFINRKIVEKIGPFIFLPIKYKIKILNYYLKKNKEVT